jgi:PemK-like, MazF-like toxin of type II toxin-antitoxin system
VRFQGIQAGPSRHNRAALASPMLVCMASQWKTFQRRLSRAAENLVFNEAPKFLRQLQNSPTLQRGIQQGIKFGLDAIAGTSESAPAITAGRPVSKDSVPTAQRARKLVYSPDLDGRADPGEIVWTWVVYQDDPTRGKDRPVLVVGRDRRTLLGLMLSSQDHDGDPDWIGIGSGSWDYDGRASWVRLDRVLDVPEESIRREGAILARETFELVAARLRAGYSWS